MSTGSINLNVPLLRKVIDWANEERVARAQVHASLALAAATAYAAVRDWMGDEARDGADWSRVTARSAGVGEAE